MIIDVFLMSSCIAISRLVHNRAYIQKLQELFSSSERPMKFCDLEDCTLKLRFY